MGTPTRSDAGGFASLDADGDGSLSAEEMAGNMRFNVAEGDTCEKEAMIECRGRYLLAVGAHGGDLAAFCDALQEFSDCLAQYVGECPAPTLHKFAGALKEFIEAENSASVCNVEDQALVFEEAPEEDLEEDQPCSQQKVELCDMAYLNALTGTKGDSCDAVKDMAKCLKAMDRSCPDHSGKAIGRSLVTAGKAYSANQVCSNFVVFE